jgi:hypothetical protein
VGLNIAGGAGIAVVAPGAAGAIGFFQDDKGVLASCFEPHSHAETGEAGTDDCDAIPLLHGNLLWPV